MLFNSISQLARAAGRALDTHRPQSDAVPDQAAGDGSPSPNVSFHLPQVGPQGEPPYPLYEGSWPDQNPTAPDVRLARPTQAQALPAQPHPVPSRQTPAARQDMQEPAGPEQMGFLAQLKRLPTIPGLSPGRTYIRCENGKLIAQSEPPDDEAFEDFFAFSEPVVLDFWKAKCHLPLPEQWAFYLEARSYCAVLFLDSMFHLSPKITLRNCLHVADKLKEALSADFATLKLTRITTQARLQIRRDSKLPIGRFADGMNPDMRSNWICMQATHLARAWLVKSGFDTLEQGRTATPVSTSDDVLRILGHMLCATEVRTSNVLGVLDAVTRDTSLSGLILDHADWLEQAFHQQAEAGDSRRMELGKTFANSQLEAVQVALILSLPEQTLAQMLPSRQQYDWLKSRALAFVGRMKMVSEMSDRVWDPHQTISDLELLQMGAGWIETPQGHHAASQLLKGLGILEENTRRREKVFATEMRMRAVDPTVTFVDDSMEDLLAWFAPSSEAALLRGESAGQSLLDNVPLPSASLLTPQPVADAMQSAVIQSNQEKRIPPQEEHQPARTEEEHQTYWKEVTARYKAQKQARAASVGTGNHAVDATDVKADSTAGSESKAATHEAGPVRRHPRERTQASRQRGSRQRVVDGRHHDVRADKHLKKSVVKARWQALMNRTGRYAEEMRAEDRHGMMSSAKDVD